MHNVKKKGFTLIELIAVLVIMAIIALIATPLVMNIIRKARISADKRSVDAYGRSIELAIASYLLDTGKFPTEVSELTIEYSGNQVECTTTQINPDSSVYLSNCKVNNREVSNYSYGSDKKVKTYKVGDTVSYNNIDFYVIKDSGAKEDTVTLLKAEPLTVDEVNLYGGVGTANNHVNMYVTSDTSASYYQKAVDNNGYGGMVYYTSETCNCLNEGCNNNTGCTTDYELSDIKYVVDAWKDANAPAATEARLITYDELFDNLGYEIIQHDSSTSKEKTENTPDFVYEYCYWTNSSVSDNNKSVYLVGSSVEAYSVYDIFGAPRLVRPVVELYKSALN